MLDSPTFLTSTLTLIILYIYRIYYGIISIVHIFGSIDVVIFFYKFGQSWINLI